jgi:hypothetical protein
MIAITMAMTRGSGNHRNKSIAHTPRTYARIM